MGWDLIELNASDKRTFDVIKRVAGTAATTGTLFEGAKGKRLVVLDEADNVYTRADRGGYRAIAELLKSTNNPVMLIANNLYAIPWEIRGMCMAVNFRRFPPEAIAQVLDRICRDLQAVAMGKRRLAVKDLALYKRDRELDVFKMLSQLLRAGSCKEARELLWALDMPPEDVLAWINENIPRMLVDPTDLARTYDALSRADIFFARTRKRQAYKLWGYASDLMTAGVAIAREGQLQYVKFQLPSSITRFARTRAARATRDNIARKIALRCHVSSRDARKHYMPYFGFIFKRGKGDGLAEELELSDAEQEYLVRLVA
jgi:replication factor C large subunit